MAGWKTVIIVKPAKAKATTWPNLCTIFLDLQRYKCCIRVVNRIVGCIRDGAGGLLIDEEPGAGAAV